AHPVGPARATSPPGRRGGRRAGTDRRRPPAPRRRRRPVAGPGGLMPGPGPRAGSADGGGHVHPAGLRRSPGPRLPLQLRVPGHPGAAVEVERARRERVLVVLPGPVLPIWEDSPARRLGPVPVPLDVGPDDPHEVVPRPVPVVRDGPAHVDGPVGVLPDRHAPVDLVPHAVPGHPGPRVRGRRGQHGRRQRQPGDGREHPLHPVHVVPPVRRPPPWHPSVTKRASSTPQPHAKSRLPARSGPQRAGYDPRPMTRTDLPALAAALRTALPDGAVLTDAPELDRYAHDDAEWADYATPAAVVLATSLEDVVTTVRTAAEHGAPVVPRGAGTGLSGGANAVAGCVVLSL